MAYELVTDLCEWNGTAWTQISPSGDWPEFRFLYGLAYDEARGVTVMFGGQDPDPNGRIFYNDTWEWDGTVWTKLVPPSPPPPRDQVTMVYDPVRREVVMFGGYPDPFQAWLDETWVWDGNEWRQRSPQLTPPADQYQAVFDRRRGRVVAYGELGDVWEWDGTEWHRPTPTQDRPRTVGHHMAYDVARGRTIVFGGSDNVGSGGVLDQTWEWDGITWRRRLLSSTPPRRTGGLAAYDAIHHRVVVFGGQGPMFAPLASVWSYGFGAIEVPPDRCFATVDTDGDGLAGCADPDCWARCHPTCAPGEMCDPTEPHCGDSVCSEVEHERMCPADCSLP
jgi:hypothetical protein